jgi:Ca2+-binding RTX toxin-like protein
LDSGQDTQTGLPQLDNPAYAALVRARVPLSERVSASTSAALSVDFAQDTLRDLALGADGADNLRTGGGDDFIYAGLGNDTLDGGTGNDLLLGGAGNDTYQFTGTWGRDTVIDADGLGSIQIGGATLSSAKGVGQRDHWAFDLGGGIYAGIAVTADASSSTGYRATIVKGTDTANTITLQNFNLNQALTSTGYLGIKLDPTQRVALIQGSAQSLGASTSNVYADLSFNTASLAGQSSQFNEGGGKTFSINLAVAAHAGDTITLALDGALSGQLNAVLGDTTVAANGAVITLVEGQTEVKFSLTSDSAISADQAGAISATYAGTGADATSATSNSWALTLRDAGEPDTTYNGDYLVKTDPYSGPGLTRTDSTGALVAVVSTGQQSYSWDSQGNLVADASGTLVIDNTIYGSAGKDSINGLTGNDLLMGGTGQDTIDGGEGNDMIGGGAGADAIDGGAGDDCLDGLERDDVVEGKTVRCAAVQGEARHYEKSSFSRNILGLYILKWHVKDTKTCSFTLRPSCGSPLVAAVGRQEVWRAGFTSTRCSLLGKHFTETR